MRIGWFNHYAFIGIGWKFGKKRYGVLIPTQWVSNLRWWFKGIV